MKNHSVVPQISIRIDDSEMPAELIQSIQSIRVKQKLSMPSQCEIEIPEAQLKTPIELLSKVGCIIQLSTESHPLPLFSGQITAIDFIYDASLKPLIIIRAYDLLHQLRKHQPVRTHNQITIYQLAQELTQELDIKVQEGDDDSPVNPRLFQYQQSDLQLLHEIGENYGQYFFLNNNTLFFTSLEGRETKNQLTLGENLLEVRLSINAETVTDSVTATGWDTQCVKPHSMTVQQSSIKDNIKIPIDSADYNSDGHRTMVDHNIQNQNQAKIIAQKELDRCFAQQLTLWGVTEGSPTLIPGTSIQVLGIDSSLEGRYVLTEVTHTIDPVKGYISEIDTTPPKIQHSKKNKNSTIGVVSQVNDPDNLGRIKVTLPSYNNIETEWLEVLSLGAGANKGQLILPSTEDTVLLLLINGEPSQSIVLGGLYGEQELPYRMVEDGIVKRFITKTAGEQKILLDDSDVSIQIETQTGHNISLKPEEISISHNNGSFITLSENATTIHSKTNLTIEAPKRSITFRGKKIDFEEA